MAQTPCFPAWRARFANLGHRTRQLRQHSLLQLDLLLSPLLPAGLLAQTDEGPNSRERIYTVRRTFFGFLFQVLKPDCSCREIVQQILALCTLHNTAQQASPGTSAYCQARARLPWDILPRLRCALAARAERGGQRWKELCVKVIDGTGISLADTQKNQRAYPQPGGQKPGCGFPLLKLVGVFSLASGALLDYAKGNKHQSELGLVQRLFDTFKAGDLILADRGFSTYAMLAQLWQRKAHGLFRLHQARPADFRQGQRLGKHDRLLVWRKPKHAHKAPFIAQHLWRSLPATVSVRMVRFTLSTPGFRTQSVTLITTLLDPKRYPAEELARLYARRWGVELWFRDLKTAMGMETLRSQSPQLVHKELEMFFIAYNLIRCLMAEAAQTYDVEGQRLSFKGAVDALRQFGIAIAQARSGKKKQQLLDRLLQLIAKDKVPARPGRREPRARKRRPKNFQILSRPRHQMVEVPHRGQYPKKS